MIYLIIFLGCLAFYIFINTYFVIITRMNIKAHVSSKFSYVHISDIHGTIHFLNGRLSSIINKLKPDFVVVTGDLSNSMNKLPKVLNDLGKIKTEKGVFVVPGNYEYEEPIGFRKQSLDTKLVEQLFKKTGNTILLKNQHSLININNCNVLLYGFDNGTYGNEAYNLNSELKHDYKIILSHCPKIINYIENNNITFDHLMAGHTHGGQLRILNNLHLKEYKYYHIGAKNYRSGLFCISRGLGTVKIPFRFNCFPEVTLYNVIPE